MADIKVGTCCYCGSKTALTLRGAQRHELACSTCGAPLSKMKMLPKASVRGAAPAATSGRPTARNPPSGDYRSKGSRPKKRKKSKGFGRKLFEEIWDVVEDIID